MSNDDENPTNKGGYTCNDDFFYNALDLSWYNMFRNWMLMALNISCSPLLCNLALPFGEFLGCIGSG